MEHHTTSSSNAIEYVKFAAVLALIVAATIILTDRLNASGADEWMRVFMGVFLLTFASFKFAGYRMFVLMFRGYDLIAKRSKVYAAAYPFVEAALGVAFLANIFPIASNVLLLAIMSVGAIGVFQEIYHRRSGVYCACLGNVIKLPLSTVSLVENIVMAIMAALMLIMLV